MYSTATIPEWQLLSDVSAGRLAGLPDSQIAVNLNLPLAVVQAVPLPRPQPQRQRAVQHQQLMKMASTLMPKVVAGDTDAMNAMLKVMKREADLLGLDAPKEQVIHNFNNDLNANESDPAKIPTHELRRRVMEAIDVTPTAPDPDRNQP